MVYAVHVFDTESNERGIGIAQDAFTRPEITLSPLTPKTAVMTVRVIPGQQLHNLILSVPHAYDYTQDYCSVLEEMNKKREANMRAIESNTTDSNRIDKRGGTYDFYERRYSRDKTFVE